MYLSKREKKIKNDEDFTQKIQSDIKDVNKFNKMALNSKNILNNLGIITSHVDLNNLLVDLASWQYDNDLEVNSKLDNNTIKKFAEFKPNTSSLPRNFAVVSPSIFRGGLIEDIEQLKALKDLGVKRVISLHNHPSIPKMCGKLNMEHIPAYMTNGKPHELGRRILGNSVSKLLDEKPCYVHCAYGHDRTGSVIARYRVENGWDPELAYKEAKSFGFKDMFTDLIDWFSDGKPPVDTNKIRKFMDGEDPYQLEQDCFTPTPNDMPFVNDSEKGYSNELTNFTPMSVSVPLSVRSY